MANEWTPQIERCIQALRDFDNAIGGGGKRGKVEDVIRSLREIDDHKLCANIATAIEAFLHGDKVQPVSSSKNPT